MKNTLSQPICQNFKAALLLSLVLALVSSSSSNAQEAAAPNNAVGAARQYFQYLVKGEYDQVPKAFHPEAVDEFSTLLQPLFDAPKETGDAMMSIFFEGLEPAEARKLSQADRFARFISGMQRRFLTGVPQLADSYKNAKYLGELPEGDLRHVLIRLKVGPNETFEHLIFKKEGDTWKMLLTPKVKTSLRQVKAAVGG
ncbi:MAG: hypothetical protein AAF514_08520 [Verrucomicrobiota bacterium]